MSRKPLQSEFDQVKNRVSVEMSHQKTALKETMSILADFISLTKSHSEGLAKLTKKEFQLFDAAHIVQPLLAQLQQQVDAQFKNLDLVLKLQNDLNIVYKEIRQAKEDLLKQMEQLRKERDEVYERVVKTGQGRELNDFTERATLQLTTQDSTVSKYEETKNTIISKIVSKFIEGRLNLLEKERNLSEGSQSRQSIQQRSSLGQSPQNLSIQKQQSQKIPLEKRLSDIRKFYTDSLTKETLPAQIKDQVGIFHSSMPHHMDIAKEFTQTDFHLFVLQLMLLHKNENTQWPTIIQHVKNKFKVTNAQFKTLQTDSPLDPQKSVYSSMITLTTVHQKKIALFRTVNEFWAQYMLNKILGLQLIVNQQVFISKFEQIIQILIFKNQIPESNFEMISEITYPMNQCLLEMILQTIVTIDIDMDYLHLICNFSEQVLHLSGAHVSTTILIMLYKQHIQPALKDRELTTILKQLDLVVNTLWKYIQSESIASLHKILKLRNCYSLFGELTSIVRHFWETLPSEGCDPFYRWLNIACNLQLEFTQKNMKELICHIMQQAGHQFWRGIIKREQVKIDNISSVNELISRIHPELLDLKKAYIDKMAFCFSDQLQGDTTVLFSGFLEGFSSELLQILSDFEKIEEPDRCSLILLQFQYLIILYKIINDDIIERDKGTPMII